MSMDTPQRHLRIADKTVELDGVNIAGNLRGMELVLDGRRNEAVLHLVPHHALDVDVMATVSVAKPSSADDMRRFLASVDPAKLERAALDRMTNGSLTSVMLEVLGEYAEDWNWEPGG